MPLAEEIPLGELPEGVIEAASKDLAKYCVGFVRVEDTPRRQDAAELGDRPRYICLCVAAGALLVDISPNSGGYLRVCPLISP